MAGACPAPWPHHHHHPPRLDRDAKCMGDSLDEAGDIEGLPSSRCASHASGEEDKCPSGRSVHLEAGSCPLQVARQLQPSVVWIQDTEKTFYKKVPQAEKRVSPPGCLVFIPDGSPHKGTSPLLKKVLVFQGDAGALSPSTEGSLRKCLSGFERSQRLEFYEA